ncbi:MFS transporter [Pokkaliibacter sp. MBI-7]|uniref:MFS transporter n=1 Tax=Pokkaliibacter sp. MBI-7 TaxID=3040600 RepID=UPI00244842CB|nr:MFS transporter [Pokkaliibacter sp. MBI-7]MDH2435956.1 MFS transporter [Pokkaliibacter sp. MBI-7]
MNLPNSKLTGATLIIGHIAGMIDLSALPIWINTLISGYQYRPIVAGALPSVFLLGAVFASIFVAKRFHKYNSRNLAIFGYWVAAMTMLAVPFLTKIEIRFALHLIAGLSIGIALSAIHGTIGKTTNPHRLFAFAYTGFGIFSLVFLGAGPQIINIFGPASFFYAIAFIFSLAATFSMLFLPAVKNQQEEKVQTKRSLAPSVRYAITGMTCMSLIQALVFSFLVQVGLAHGFDKNNIDIMLIVLGMVNLIPGMVAALLQKRINTFQVAKTGPVLQAISAIAIMATSTFPLYAVFAIFFPAIQVFTHTFIFGYLAKQDGEGRAVAGTPAMLMTGSAIGPFLGGFLIEIAGFSAIGIAAIIIGTVSTLLFFIAARKDAFLESPLYASE